MLRLEEAARYGAVLDVSRAVTGARDPRELVVRADFCPGIATPQLADELRDLGAREGKRQAGSFLAERLPRRLAEALFANADLPLDRRAAELSNIERDRLVEQVKQCAIRVTGSRGFEKAEVTAGGVVLNEVHSSTMESKIVPGLYLAGEILDLDGYIGGYNFQAAFSTGWLAGGEV